MTAADDYSPRKITKEWEGYQIAADVAFRDVRPDDYLVRGIRSAPGAARDAGVKPA